MSQAILADYADCDRLDVSRKLDPKRRSDLGQFLTPSPIVHFMASLFDKFQNEGINILDPGAGVGSLTAGIVDEICKRSKRPRSVHLTTYEIDPLLGEYLKRTLSNCEQKLKNAKIITSISIHNCDFIKDGVDRLQSNLFNHSDRGEAFSHIIMNPPYKKIHSKSEYRNLLSSVGIETSNLYTGFLSIAIKLLLPGGELVAIVPRSFCNGPYFKPFRKFLFDKMAIKKIHIFTSRNKAFKDDNVLQENIIFHAVKDAKQAEITITSSLCGEFLEDENGKFFAPDMTIRTVPFSAIVKPNDPESFIHITTTDLEQQIVDRISVFNHSLYDLGIEVSTGPVVDFRLKDDIHKNPSQNTVPLLYPTHFQGGKLKWPKQGRKPNAIEVTENSEKWLWSNKGHYVVTKRFTSKEEKRRIVASIYDSSLPGSLVGFENHLNVFHQKRIGLSENVAKGLSIFLNSTLVDKFFRQFSGHTQVNATDLRLLHYPDRGTLERLGESLGNEQPTQKEIDTLINLEIENMSSDEKTDPIKAQNKIDEALSIVKALGLPKGQHNERSALTLLAILNLRPEENWQDIKKPLIGITPIMDFCRDHYGREYAPNTRETFRRQTMHQFVDAGISLYNPDQPDRPVNSPKACYQISPEAFDVIRTFDTSDWESALVNFLKVRPSLAKRYAKEREMHMIPVKVDGEQEITLTPGKHSQLIKDIIYEFAKRFAPGAEVISVGDTGDKIGFFKSERLKELGVEINKYGKMPDVVLYFPEKNWLLLCEAVTSHGPVDAKRHEELAILFEKAKPGLVFVTAFPDRTTMARYLTEISWETEVWVAEAPTHLIHFNGERFLGPYE